MQDQLLCNIFNKIEEVVDIIASIVLFVGYMYI